MTNTPEGLMERLDAACEGERFGVTIVPTEDLHDLRQALSTAQQDRERMRGAVLKAKELMRQIAGRTLENRTEALADEAFSILRQALKEKVDE